MVLSNIVQKTPHHFEHSALPAIERTEYPIQTDIHTDGTDCTSLIPDVESKHESPRDLDHFRENHYCLTIHANF